MFQRACKLIAGLILLAGLLWLARPSLARAPQPPAEADRGPGSPVAAAPEAALSTTTLNPDADTQISSSDADTNYGSDPTMISGNLYGVSTYRAFVHFGLSSIPNTALVQGATLRLYESFSYGDNPNFKMELYRVDAAWDENTLNWNTQPVTVIATGITTTVDNNVGWFEWDAATLVQDWLDDDNFGLVLRAVDESEEFAREFDTREGTYPPQLVITYTLPNLAVDLFTYDGVTVTRDVPIGDQIGLRVRNDGQAPVPTGYFIGFYVSPDGTITTGDTLLTGGRISGPALAAGQTVTVTVPSSARVPAGYPLCSSYLGVILDETDTISETNEGDNTAVVSVVVLPSSPYTWMVNTTDDDLSPVSLRCALTYARAGDTIQFDPAVFPPGAPASILLTEALPPITQGDLTIDGSGAGVILDGTNLPAGTSGLVLASDGNTVASLQIVSMPGSGIIIQGDNNLIGGGGAAQRGRLAVSDVSRPPAAPANVISGNGGNGISIQGDGNVVQGNYIGTDDTGLLAYANSGSGIYLSGGTQNQIGGSGAGQGNLISGNAGSGVYLWGVSSTIVQGNIVGADLAGEEALPNGGWGLWLFNASQSKIGRSPAGTRTVDKCETPCNLVSGNTSGGVLIDGRASVFNQFYWNFVGINMAGDAALPNTGAGVQISGGAHDNSIGNIANRGNLISGNTAAGVLISGRGTDRNGVYDNVIGLDADENTSLGNQYGVEIRDGAQDNTVGGVAVGAQNTIAGNLSHGVYIHDSETSGNLVESNFIGLEYDETYGNRGNGGAGVLVALGARGNTIGVDGNFYPGNVLAQNAGAGVELDTAYDNFVLGNRIGQLKNGTPAGNAKGVFIRNGASRNEVQGNLIAYNLGSGVDIRSGAQNNDVGGTGGDDVNVIVTNAIHGVYLSGAATTGNTIASNRIGTDADAQDGMGNGLVGIYLEDGPHHNVIVTNHIVNATTAAIALNDADDNQINDNWIGLTTNQASDAVVLGNSGHGIYLLNGASDNEMRHNVITASGGDGVRVEQDVGDPPTVGNTISENSIYGNAGKGIYLNGGNANLLPPTEIDFFQFLGFEIRGRTCPLCTVEVFSDDSTEGEQFEASEQADAGGNFSFRPAGRTHSYFTLTATDLDGNTSEFGAVDDLEAFALEVTQAIQSLDNSVPLVASKPTFVRLHVRSGTGTEVISVTARLEGWRDNLYMGALDPAGSGCDPEITVWPVPDRGILNHSFCFRLPRAWAGVGNLRLVGRVNPASTIPETNFDDNSWEAAVNFLEAPEFNQKLFKVNYREGMVRKWEWKFLGDYNENDGFTVGDVDGDGSDEILIANSETGVVTVWGFLGISDVITVETSFDGNFTTGDSIAVGNVDYDAATEVLIAHDGGGVNVFQWDDGSGSLFPQNSFGASFSEGDAFAVGNVIPDAGATIDEILVAYDGSDTVIAWQWNSMLWVGVAVFELEQGFTPGYGFAVGDVLDGDGLDEIVVASDDTHRVDVFQWNGATSTWVNAGSFDGGDTGGFMLDDALAVGDVDGDTGGGVMLAEILIAGDVCGCVDVFKLQGGGANVGWTWVSRFDGYNPPESAKGEYVYTQDGGFATGDVDGDGRAEAISAHIDVHPGKDGDPGTGDDWDVEVFKKTAPGAWRYIEPSDSSIDKLASYFRRWFPFGQMQLEVEQLDLPQDLGTPSNRDIHAQIKSRLNRDESSENRPVIPAIGKIDTLTAKMTFTGNWRTRIAGCASVLSCIHEAGHVLRQGHPMHPDTNEPLCRARGGKPYEYPGGIIGGPEGAEDRFYGFDVGDGALGDLPDVHAGEDTLDVMCYGSPRWISDIHYRGILQDVIDRPTQLEQRNTLGNTITWTTQSKSPQEQDFLFFSAYMELSRITGKIDAMFTLRNTTSTSLPVSSAIALRLEDSSGSILAEYPLYTDGSVHEDEADVYDEDLVFLDGVVPYPSGTAVISFLYQDSVVMSRTVSANPPAVTLTYPNGGDMITDSVTVTWQASDADGDELHFTVLYSADGGNTWKTLVARWPGNNYTVDTTRLPGSATGRFRVIAEDGINTGQDDSDSDVSVPFRPPVVVIGWPMDEATYVFSHTVILSGEASDPDKQPIGESNFVWTSDLDGALGTGRELVLTNLSLGTHTITLTVTDAGGLTGEDSVQLTVVETWSPPPPPNKIYLPLVLR